MTMRVEIRPINLRGKPLKKAERNALAPVRGNLKVFENKLHAFGRAVRCARVLSTSDGLEADLLPELLDAELLWLDDKAIRLRGVEQVDGTLFGQTWDIKVL
ncbi:hypothetical protein [Aquabacterium sp.]|jgi:hypothetical protein|uniref:hypothetical protein n=1 Tax=Aquabacterium sp. TaxID=1872578 RepID=UPI0035AFB5E1